MFPADGVDTGLLLAWAAGRSISRGLPPSVIDDGAIRVDTGLPSETRRYLFAAASPAIATLAATIDEPRILIKVCAPLADLMALLPAWRAHPQAYFMTCDGAMRSPARPLPAAYALTVVATGSVRIARVDTSGGAIVASGRAVRYDGLTVYDQIVTDPDHRRRGLGGHLMHALADAFDFPAVRHALAATAAGHALYTRLGWSARSFYSTAERIALADRN